MPKSIPGVTLRDPEADDVKRIVFVYKKDEISGDDVIEASVAYQLVDDGAVVFDAYKSFGKELSAGALFNDLIALRSGKVVNAIFAEEGFS